MKKGLYNRRLIALENLKKHLNDNQANLSASISDEEEKKFKSNIKRINNEILILEEHMK